MPVGLPPVPDFRPDPVNATQFISDFRHLFPAMWELKGRIQSENALALGTAITVSGVVTRISGNDVLVTTPDLGSGSDAIARRAIGEAEIVTAAAGFQERRSLTFSPISLMFFTSGMPPADHSDAIQRAREGLYRDLATGPTREIERVEIDRGDAAEGPREILRVNHGERPARLSWLE